MPQSIDHIILGPGEKTSRKLNGSRIVKGLKRGKQLIQEIKKCSPDAVMIYGYGSIAHIMLLEWCRFSKTPCMLWGDSNILGDNIKGLKALIKMHVVSRLVKNCDAILPCGHLGAEYFKKYGATQQQIFMVPNEPDYSLISELTKSPDERVMSELGLDPSRRRFIFSGRLVDIKRVDLLIDGFLKIAEQRPNWDLIIVGGGPMESRLKERVPDKFRERVIWAGFVSAFQKMCALYGHADVLVLPSDFEPWALVVNEAACAGLAIVCSDVIGAAKELLQDRENGRLFSKGNLSSLAEALLDVSDQANLYRYRTASKSVLCNWRRTADPVNGFRRAIDYCLKPE